MRANLLWLFLLFPFLVLAQKNKTELVNLSLDDVSLEVIFDTLSSQTDYFFSYNSELFPKGSRYSITAEDEPLDQFLSRLLVGTQLKYSFYKDQIILNYQPPEDQVIRKKNFFSITGKVKDEKGNPIGGVNVFLNGTNIGAFSDIDGNYNLESIPPGFYDIVFSHVGYENGIYQLTEYQGGTRIQNHSLAPDIGELEEVEVVSKRVTNRQNIWLSYYQTFKEEVLGSSANAQLCVIENPEVIKFFFDENDGQLTAYANEAIVIRNDALGYRIDYYLESFKKESDDLRFRGKMRFRNQEAISGKERREWRRNRKDSYYGSFNHFKKSLLNEELRKEGFRIYATKNLNDFDKKEALQLTEKDILVYKGDEYELNFSRNLVIEYRKEKESLDFLKESEFTYTLYSDQINEDGILIQDPGNQISVIRLLRSPVRIDLTGQIVDKFALTTYGYWSWERVGDLVPINYDPKWDNL